MMQKWRGCCVHTRSSIHLQLHQITTSLAIVSYDLTCPSHLCIRGRCKLYYITAGGHSYNHFDGQKRENGGLGQEERHGAALRGGAHITHRYT